MKTIVKNPILYDLLYQDVVEDISMYIKLLKNKKTILEFGAGTGRITIPLAKQGHYIDAIDIEVGMLETLSNKIKNDSNSKERIRPILGNMCGYVSEHLYDVVIIPLTSFNYLLTEEQQLSCLKSVYKNLKADGFAIVELLSKNTYDDINLDDTFRFVKKIVLSETQYYDYYRNTKLDIKSMKVVQKRLFKLFEDGKLITIENLIWENRFVTIENFKRLVEMENLYIEEIYGNCQLKRYSENSEDVFVKIRRVVNGRKAS